MRLAFPIFAVLALSLPAFAHEDHSHEAAVEPAPHGGELRDAPPYKAELVLNGDQAKIYVYDRALKPASLKAQSLEGTIRLPKQKKDTAVTFRREGESFNGALPGVSKVHRYDLHVYLNEGGKKTLIDFGVDNIH